MQNIVTVFDLCSFYLAAPIVLMHVLVYHTPIGCFLLPPSRASISNRAV